jgi:aminoglycoside phosphotransferase (APT) family kinase protein
MPFTSISESLGHYLCIKVPYLTNLAVLAIERIEGGWEGDVFAFDLSFLDKGTVQTRPMILKLYQEPGLELLGQKHTREFEALRQLNNEGYPAPDVYLLESDSCYLGKPFVIMERLAGARLDKLLEQYSPAEREAQYGEMCKLFVRLHSLDWRNFTALGDVPAVESAIERELQRFLQIGSAAGASSAEPALAWLWQRASSVTGSRLALAHWDFHAGNIVCDSHGNLSVVDWCGAGVTDCRFDLAWSTLFLGDFAPKFIALYAELAGHPVDDFDFFLAFAYLRRILSITISLQHSPELLGMRAEAAEHMRLQYHRLHALHNQWLGLTGVSL